MSTTPSLPPLFHEAVRSYRARLYRLTFCGWMVRAAVAFIVPFILSMALDRYWDFSVNIRIGLLVLTFAVPLLSIRWLLPQPIWDSGEESLAGMIDRACPDLRDGLRSSMNLASKDTPGFMLSHSIGHVESELSVGRVRGLINWGQTPAWLGALILLAGFIGSLTFSPVVQLDLLVKRFFDPWGNYPRPSFTRIMVDVPDALSLTQGDDYQLRVALEGAVRPGMGCFLHRSVNEADTVERHRHRYQTLPMSPMPNHKFVFRIKGLARPFDYFITAGDGRTKIRKIAMIPRPRIKRIRVQYKFPRYTRLPLEEKELRIKEIKAIEGTRVRLFLKTDLPIRASWAEAGKKRLKIRWDRERTEGDFTFRLERSDSLSIHLAADNGTTNKFDTPYNLKAIQDNPPAVSYIDVPRQLTVFRDDLIRFTYRGYDDFGIEEVFVRFKHDGDRESRYLSLEFPKAGVKQFKGESVIEVSEIIDRGPYGPPADAFDISLVMTDGKDQEGATQKLSFQVITDSPDRQLADLIRWHKEYQRSMEQAVKTLRSQATQLKILVEGMDENTEFTPKHQQRLDSILRNFTRIRVRNPFKFSDRQGSVYRYGFYPRREGRAAEELFTLPFSLLTSAGYNREAAKSKDVKKRQKALIQLKELVESQRDKADAFHTMLLATLRENQLQLLSYLAETWVQETGRMAQLENAQSLEAIQEKQRERLESINKLITELGEFEADASNESAREAVKAAKAENLVAAKNAFERLLAALRKGTELDGHFQKTLWEWHRQNPTVERMKFAAEHSNESGLAKSLLMRTVLRGDDPYVDEAQFLQECIAYHAVIADPASRRDLISQSAALEAEQQQFDLFVRCWLLVRDIEDFRSELRVGQLRPDDAVYRKKLMQIRESFLALLRDVSTDMFADVGPMLGQVLELARYRQSFMAWNETPDVLLPGSGGLLNHLRDINKGLMPKALAGLQKMKPLLLSALQTVSKNMLAEIPVIEHEMKELLVEVKEAGGERLDLLSDTERKRMLRAREFGRKSPKRERLEFADRLIHRLTGHSVTVAQAIDFIEKMWALNPQPADTHWLHAAENVTEVLRTFVERTYDKTGQIYGSNRLAAKGYPGILKEVHKNLAAVIPDLRALARDVAYLGQGNAKAVLEQPDFERRLAVIHKKKSYRVTLQWLDSHAAFLREQLPQSSTENIDATLASYAHHSLDKVPYWRALYTHLLKLSSQETYSLTAPKGWIESFEAEIATVRVIIRGLQPLPEELKLLQEALDDLPSLLKDLKADANANESLQADLQDWQGLLLAVLSNIEDKLDREPLKFRPRRRYGTSPRFDLDVALKLIVRDEARWLQRVKEEQEHTINNRFQIMLAKAKGKALENATKDAAWQFSHLLARRHRSMSAQSIQSAGLPFDLGEGEGRKPKMPEYLYRELKRAMNRNYPQQFKEMGLKYLKELSEDSF